MNPINATTATPATAKPGRWEALRADLTECRETLDSIRLLFDAACTKGFSWREIARRQAEQARAVLARLDATT